MNGFLCVLKPPGMTSSDVVVRVRRMLPKGTKVGHAGTLDPENHADIVILPAVAPTKESTGLTEGKHCNACNTTLVAQEVVMMLPATGDGAMPALWIALSAAGVVGMIAVMKKKRAY